MKKLAALFAALFLILCCGAASAEVTLVYAEADPPGSIAGQMASDFKGRLEELSQGKVRVDIRYNGALGTEDQVVRSLLAGRDGIDAARISASALSGYGCTGAGLLNLPYTFVSREHFWKFAESDLAKKFLNEPRQKGLGIRGLAYGEEGFRHFFTGSAVSSYQDLCGMKLRVSKSKAMAGMVKCLGGDPQNVSFSGLYCALQDGTVDGAEQSVVNYRANGFREVAPNLFLDGHTVDAIQIVITDAAWKRLTKEQRGYVTEAARYAAEQNKINSRSREEEALAALRASGVNVVECPAEDKAALAALCRPVISARTKGLEKLYGQITGMR